MYVGNKNFVDNLINSMKCTDHTCCCLPIRSGVVIISLIALGAGVMDLLSYDGQCNARCGCVRQQVGSLRKLLVTMFQVANALLLLASVLEITFLISIYVWFTMGFIVMGFVIAILDFLYRSLRKGVKGFVLFLADVSFLFALYLCLPLVDEYRREIINSRNK